MTEAVQESAGNFFPERQVKKNENEKRKTKNENEKQK
jgi:hypothetical protein